MSYRTILVHLDNTERAADVLKVATDLADSHQAHLIGLYVIPPLDIYVSSELPVPVELTQNHQKWHRELSAALQRRFDEVTANAAFVAEWRELDAGPLSVADTIVELAHTVDLVIASQKDPADREHAHHDLPERLILSASRPVLLVPVSKTLNSLGRRIFVAWDGGNEATRAVFDALPMLRNADSVTVHRVNPLYYDRHRLLGTAAELVNSLSRHGVNVTLSQSDARGAEVGEELLQFAQDQGADLMVMGAYGHSRLREYLFGGTTRRMLMDMPIPVLMSH